MGLRTRCAARSCSLSCSSKRQQGPQPAQHLNLSISQIGQWSAGWSLMDSSVAASTPSLACSILARAASTMADSGDMSCSCKGSGSPVPVPEGVI